MATEKTPSEFTGGARSFLYVKPKGKKANEYEELSQYIQQDPAAFGRAGWPMRFRGGRAPYVDESTKVRSTNWWEFKDPDKHWYRTWAAMQSAAEETIENLVELQRSSGALAALDETWVNQVLGPVYGAYACVEWGLFRAFSYAMREARSDTITFAFTFNAGDKLRHAHDIALYDLDLEESRPGYSSTVGKESWLNEPALQPARKVVEEIAYLPDWAEVEIAVNLAFEPLFGSLIRQELLAGHAVLNGDAATPLILATAERDAQRNARVAREFARTLTMDSEHGAANAKVIGEWIRDWTERVKVACEAAAPLFDRPARKSAGFAASYERVQAGQGASLATLSKETEGRISA